MSNLELLRGLAGRDVAVCAAVKANAYGHDVTLVAPLLVQAGVDCLAVAIVDEGVQLRQLGIKLPILIFGALADDEWTTVAQADLQPVLSSHRQLRLLEQAARSTGRVIKVHLKVDTGMGRLGCKPEEAPELAQALVHTLGLEFEGLCTHFASSEGGGLISPEQQAAVFAEVQRQLGSRGFSPLHVHVSNSGGILNGVNLPVSLVRPGIALYGCDPAAKKNSPLKPVMELVSRVGFVKTVAAGTRLSYGSRYSTTRLTDVATIPIGYADGYRRSFTNVAPLLVGGTLRTVSGTVCMDQFMVDLGPDSGVREGDPVVLFGPPDPGAENPVPTVDDLAKLAGTISYELLCGIAARVPRILVT